MFAAGAVGICFILWNRGVAGRGLVLTKQLQVGPRPIALVRHVIHPSSAQ